MALTRITSSVIKDSTITEGKFDTQYLNATGSPDTGQHPITLELVKDQRFLVPVIIYYH